MNYRGPCRKTYKTMDIFTLGKSLNCWPNTTLSSKKTITEKLLSQLIITQESFMIYAFNNIEQPYLGNILAKPESNI